MHKYIWTWFFLLICTVSVSAQNKGYSYRFKVKGVQDTTVFMANYYGNKQYYNDTAEVNSEGEFVFEGKGSKPAGIYSIIMPDKQTYFEFIINEPSFEIETDKEDIVGSMKTKGSPENEAYYAYIRYINNWQREQKALSDKRENSSGKEKEQIDARLEKMQEESKAFRKEFIEKHGDLFAGKIMKTSEDPEVPEPPVLEDGSVDSAFQFTYFREHYLDNVDLRDERLLRTSVLHRKLEFYIEKLTPQIPDSICQAMDHVIELAGDTGLIFKYVIQYFTNKYEKSKIMGMDAVFVCMAEKYYTVEGTTWWLDSAQLAEITDTYETRRNLLIGKKAENIILPDTSDQWQSLYDIDAEYTVLIFWDPNCGHCKKEMPKLKTFYDEWKSKGVEVFGVSTEFENKDWRKYVRNNDLNWINVSDNPEINENAFKYIGANKTTLNSLNFRDYWDLFSTPQLYLLDKDKRIVAKRLTADQLSGFIENHRKQQERAAQ